MGVDRAVCHQPDSFQLLLEIQRNETRGANAEDRDALGRYDIGDDGREIPLRESIRNVSSTDFRSGTQFFLDDRIQAIAGQNITRIA